MKPTLLPGSELELLPAEMIRPGYDLKPAFPTLEQCRAVALGCLRCPLSQSRTRVVFGDGPEHVGGIMLVGEAPGSEEDARGLPFVGASGRLLDQLLHDAGLERSEIYVTNVNKCRPPGNRAPTAAEQQACRPYLETQLAFLRPRILLMAGAIPMKRLANPTLSITRLRGKWMALPGDILGMVLFHPSYLLRSRERTPGSPWDLTRQDLREVKRVYEMLARGRV